MKFSSINTFKKNLLPTGLLLSSAILIGVSGSALANEDLGKVSGGMSWDSVEPEPHICLPGVGPGHPLFCPF